MEEARAFCNFYGKRLPHSVFDASHKVVRRITIFYPDAATHLAELVQTSWYWPKTYLLLWNALSLLLRNKQNKKRKPMQKSKPLFEKRKNKSKKNQTTILKKQKQSKKKQTGYTFICGCFFFLLFCSVFFRTLFRFLISFFFFFVCFLLFFFLRWPDVRDLRTCKQLVEKSEKSAKKNENKAKKNTKKSGKHEKNNGKNK